MLVQLEGTWYAAGMAWHTWTGDLKEKGGVTIPPSPRAVTSAFRLPKGAFLACIPAAEGGFAIADYRGAITAKQAVFPLAAALQRVIRDAVIVWSIPDSDVKHLIVIEGGVVVTDICGDQLDVYSLLDAVNKELPLHSDCIAPDMAERHGFNEVKRDTLIAAAIRIRLPRESAFAPAKTANYAPILFTLVLATLGVGAFLYLQSHKKPVIPEYQLQEEREAQARALAREEELRWLAADMSQMAPAPRIRAVADFIESRGFDRMAGYQLSEVIYASPAFDEPSAMPGADGGREAAVSSVQLHLRLRKQGGSFLALREAAKQIQVEVPMAQASMNEIRAFMRMPHGANLYQPTMPNEVEARLTAAAESHVYLTDAFQRFDAGGDIGYTIAESAQIQSRTQMPSPRNARAINDLPPESAMSVMVPYSTRTINVRGAGLWRLRGLADALPAGHPFLVNKITTTINQSGKLLWTVEGIIYAH